MNIPDVIKETSDGYFRSSILDEMLGRREVNCIGEIDMERVNGLIVQLLQLEKEDPDAQITMYINSPGGSVVDGLALYDVMQAISCPIRTVCVGMAYSMGAILFAAGDKRDMLPHSKIMIHDPLVTHIGGSALQVQTESKKLLDVRRATNEILAKHTGKTIRQIEAKTCRDCYFTAEEAVKFGLADSIIERM
ncbi:MAG: ATP-dependent Clp protease proteolytic subunit [Lachnospiraceae bacterium]|nr:ATP-dependent Clp protease proteolytic subunit [Lachnospiraceae bacterium]